MRIVPQPGELPHALESARREALNAFGDDRIYLEKLIEHPHHIEFQVFGDDHGHAVHLFERECSVQRRHQKIIEETPSPLLDADLRERMGEAAVAAVRAAGYTNAGTLEFLVDAQRNFYFLEMNTRLQVEHPITEAVTGVDLVKLQIRVAAGEPLPFTQADLTQRGHAIECRIYAEDPANDFLPAIGQVLTAVEPVGPGVRVDAGVTTGDEVTLHYDPMIAKLIVLGENRRDAIGKMQWALHHYVILGDVITNIAFLRLVLSHPRFLAGDTTTDFVEGRGARGDILTQRHRDAETRRENQISVEPRDQRDSGERGNGRGEAQDSPIAQSLNLSISQSPISSSPSPRWPRYCKARRLRPMRLQRTAILLGHGGRAMAFGWAQPGRVRNERSCLPTAD